MYVHKCAYNFSMKEITYEEGRKEKGRNEGRMGGREAESKIKSVRGDEMVSER